MGNPSKFLIRQQAEPVQSRINPVQELIGQPMPQDDLLHRQPVIDWPKPS